ncbi:MAG: ribbon-helix-helix protein, CopG family [Ardenticatenaceae bacterium]
MTKVIQVPMEEALVRALDSWAQELGRSRADIIREACRRYLKHVEREELDRVYREGYDRVPEEPIMARTQAALLAEVLPREDW